MRTYTTTYKLQKTLVIMIVFINLGTLCFVAPLSQNLSDLGNELGHRYYLIIWAASASLYFLFYTYVIMQQSNYKNRLVTLCLCISCIGMLISVLLPYAPHQLPVLAKWHTRTAIASTTLYVLTFYMYLFHLMKKDFLLFQQRCSRFTTLVSFDLLLYLIHGGVSTLLEITFTIGMSYLLLHMRQNP